MHFVIKLICCTVSDGWTAYFSNTDIVSISRHRTDIVSKSKPRCRRITRAISDTVIDAVRSRHDRVTRHRQTLEAHRLSSRRLAFASSVPRTNFGGLGRDLEGADLGSHILTLSVADLARRDGATDVPSRGRWPVRLPVRCRLDSNSGQVVHSLESPQ